MPKIRLQAAEERLRLLQEAAGLGVWEYWPETGEHWFSPEYLRLYGVTPAHADAFDMEAWRAALHPDDRERMRAARSAMVCTGHLDEEFRIRRVDTGELRWIHSKAARFERTSGPLLIGVNHDITARKLAMEAAQERDQRLRMAFAAAGTFAWDWDVTTGRVEWSEQGEAALRLPQGGFGGTVEAFRELVHPDDRAAVEAALARALDGTANEYVAEFRMRRGDGTWRRTATRGIVQRDGAGRPVRVFGIDHDISARPAAAHPDHDAGSQPSDAAPWPHDAAHAVRLCEQRYQAALRGAAIAVFEQDLDLRYTWIDNPTLDFVPEAVIGRTDFDLFEDAEDAARLTALKRRVIAEGIGVREEIALRHKGVVRHYDLAIQPVRDAGDAVMGIICAFVDVTVRKRNEAALAESQERFDQAAEAARLAAYEVQADKVARATRTFWDLYGLPYDVPFDFDTFLSRVHPDDRAAVMADHARLAESGGRFRAEFRIVWPDGSIRWLETRGDAEPGAADFPGRIRGVILDITERKAAEAERRDHEQRLRSVLDGMAEGFGLLAPDFTILDQNREALRMDGRSREEIVGRSHWEAFPGSEHSELGRQFKRAMAEREPAFLQHRYVWPDGRARWLEMRAYPTPDGMLAVFWRDVTARRDAEEALRRSEARFRTFVEASSKVIWLLTADGVVGEPIPSWQAWTGQSWDEARGAGFLDAIHPDDREAAVEAWKAALARGDTYEVEYRLRRHDGEWRTVAARGAPVRDDAGAISEWICTGVDITERRAAELALSQSEARLRLATEVAEIGFWDVDPVSDVLIWPPIVKAMFGISADRPVSMSDDFYACLHPGDRDRVTAAYLAACDPQRRALYDVQYRTIGKEDGVVRWVAAKGRGIFDEQGRCVRVIGTAIDISAHKTLAEALERSEIELRRLNEELEERVRTEVAAREAAQRRLAQAQRLEALGQLAGGIAHDINNVLQAVEGGASLIAKRSGDAGDVSRFARMVIDAARRGSAITRRLLAFSRRGDIRAEAFDPVALLTDVREVLIHTLGPGIGVRVVAPAGMRPGLADKGQLETVLVNLATNARDAMDGQGVLTLTAEDENLPSERLRALASRELPPGDYVHIAVADTGCGMPEAVLARVTEPFFTTKPEGQGTGLGLAMARGFIEQSDGAIAIESEVGRGTIVHLWLPAAGTDERESSRLSFAVEADSAAGHILLVDDEAVVREVLAEQLRSAGYRVTAVGNAAGALSALRDDEPVDLLISDLSMPGIDGVALVQTFHGLRPDVPAILLTGFATSAAETAVGSALGGMVSLLRKPVTRDELVARVKVLIEGAKPFRSDAGEN